MNSTIADTVHSAQRAAHDVKNEATDVAQLTRTTLIEYATHTVKFLAALRVLRLGAVDSLLGGVGLERRRRGVHPAVWFTAGAVVAGGTALALAPSSGEDLRRRIARWIDRGVDEVQKEVQQIEAGVREQIGEVKRQIVSKRNDAAEANPNSGNDGRHHSV